MSKLFIRCVPRLLNADRNRENNTNLKVKEHQLSRFYDVPKSKRHPQQWRDCSKLPPKRIKTFPSAGKLMAMIFWDLKEKRLIDYIARGQVINEIHILSCSSRQS